MKKKISILQQIIAYKQGRREGGMAMTFQNLYFFGFFSSIFYY